MSNEQKPWDIRHTLAEQPWDNQRQLFATISLIVVMGIVIAALYLIQTTTTTITARELQEMSDERSEMERGNERLNAEIAQLKSLPRMMTRAAELGYRPVETDEIQYLIVDGYRYNRPAFTPTPTPTPEGDGAIYDETLGGWLKKQWDYIRKQFDEWRDNDD